MCDLTLISGAAVVVIALNAELLDRSVSRGCRAAAMDRWTGAAILFHSHDWDAQLLKQVLASGALFVGVMGSSKNHEQRCAELRRRGLSEAKLMRMTAPIGVIPSMRDPETLAISVLAQAIDRYNAAFFVVHRQSKRA